MTETMEMIVTINGTEANPWHKWGLKQNPFPQLGKAEHDAGEMRIASLDGDPITSADDIRERLKGFAPEFIDGIIERWEPGKRVSFKLTFPAKRS